MAVQLNRLLCHDDEQMDEIYGLVTEAFRAGQDKVQLQAFPFRMTEANRHSMQP